MKKKVQKISIFLLFVLFLGTSAYGQATMGIPFIQNFPKKHYTAATQNWKGLKDKNGVVYFANNDGLLCFDGQNWQVFPLEKQSFLRAIALDQNGIIYAGGQNELGFFAPNNQGKWTYYSLADKIPEVHQNFDDIWDIVIHSSGVYFRASNKVFKYYNGELTTFSPQGYFNYLGILNDEVIVQDDYQNLFSISGKAMEKVLTMPQKAQITSIIPLEENKNLIATLNNGFYIQADKHIVPWDNEEPDFFRKNEIFSVQRLSDGNIAVGTLLAGFVVLSPSGKKILHIQRNNGLLNNTVLSILEDNNQNIWLGLDNGISHIKYNSPFSRFFPDANIESTGYSTIIKDNHFYFGTSNGVYSLAQSTQLTDKQAFQKIQGSDGQVRNIDIINNTLVISHHKRPLKIINGNAYPIAPEGGYWLFQRLKKDTNFVIAGTYHGLSLFDKELNYIHKIDGFDESSRFMEQDEQGNIWVAHPNKGIYKLALNNAKNQVAVTKYGKEDGLPSNLLNHVFTISNELLFPTNEGIYSFDTKANRFSPNLSYNDLLSGQHRIRRLSETESGDIWYISSTEIGKLKIQEKSLSKEINILRFSQVSDQLVDGFEYIYPFGDDAILPAEQGFIYYDSQKKWTDQLDFNLIFSDISLTNHGDSTIFSGNYYDGQQVLFKQPDSAIFRFPFRENGIRFSFSATKYLWPEKVKYRYKLTGLEDNWSTWTSKSVKEYNNLKGGKYAFIVQAKDEFDNLTNPITYSFKIKPAWYASIVAYILYFLAFTGLLAWIYRFYAKKYDHQKEIAQRSEVIIDQLKHEKLEADILHKNRELISTTLHLAHKNEVFKRVKSDIDKLSKTCTDLDTKANLMAIIKVLSTEEDAEAGWEEFVAHFNKLHTGFFDNLKSSYPELSPKDLKMCAYLRMNLTTKEISTLSNITPRGVEGARYRLRKKFGLTGNDNLVAFLMDGV